MPKLPKLPKLPGLPDPENALAIIDKAGNALDMGLGLIDKFADRIDHVADKIGPPEERKPPKTAPTSHKEAPISEKLTSTITRLPLQPELPTREETTKELKRRLGKELYRAELDLSSKLRIAGKPCDCQPGDSIIYVNGDIHPVLTMVEAYKRKTRKTVSHRGLEQPITSHLCRKHQGTMRCLDVAYLDTPFKATPEHPVLVAKEGWRWNWRTLGGIDESKLDWVQVKDVTPGDFMVFPRMDNANDIAIITPDLAEILGWYLAKGCKTNNRIVISLGYHEKANIDRVIELFHNTFGKEPKLHYRTTSLHLAFANQEFTSLFNVFGSNALNKRLPQWCLSLPTEKQGRLLRGLFLGDGCITKNHLSYATSSKDLAYQIHFLLFRLGILHSFSSRMMQHGRIDGREIIPRTETYFIHVSGDAMARLAAISGISWEQTQARAPRNLGWAGEGFMFLPVRAARNEDYDGLVYNLSVKEDQSYLTPHGIAHNCLDSKHTLGLEAAAEELIAQEPGNPVYTEILQWIKDNHDKVTIEAIVSGKYDEEYPQMAAEFKGFRKRIMGTTVLSAMMQPEKPVTLEEAKKLAAEEAEKEVERKWQSQEKKPVI